MKHGVLFLFGNSVFTTRIWIFLYPPYNAVGYLPYREGTYTCPWVKFKLSVSFPEARGVLFDLRCLRRAGFSSAFGV